MTATQKELYNSKEFWEKRLEQQRQYFDNYLFKYHFEWSGRKQQLIESASEVLDIINDRLEQINNGGTTEIHGQASPVG